MAKRRRVAQTPNVLLAPVGGIDDTSAEANMDAKFAMEMLNFFPEAQSLRVRFGYREHVTGMTANGQTLMPYYNPNGSQKLFCATDDGIYDVTLADETPPLVHVLTEGRCNWTTITNAAGTYLVGCNGTDAAFFYDGTNWASFVAVGVPANPGDVNGLAPADFKFVAVHKNRLWVIKKGTSEAYYFPVDAIGGTVSPFYLGANLKLGGYLENCFSYTFDNGESPDDVLVFQSSRGQLLAYSGSDPSTAATWALTAKYFVGAPLGDRTIADLNGDTVLLNVYGVVSTAQIANGGYSLGSSEGTVGGKISRTLNDIAFQRSNAPGWELHSSPAFQYIILHLPAVGEHTPLQYVMNSITGAWTTFDLPAVTFSEFDGHLYFTDDTGRVLRYEEGLTVDNVQFDGTGGVGISAGFKQAPTYLGTPNQRKHFKLIRLIFNSFGAPGYRYSLLIDFEYGGINSAPSPTPFLEGGGALWDLGLWDEALWSPPRRRFQRWDGLSGDGYCASLVVRTFTTLDTNYSASNWVVEPGMSL